MGIVEVAGLARKLARTGVVKEIAGFDDVALLASGAPIDPKLLRHDIHRRHRAYTRVLKTITDGLKELPDVHSALEQIAKFEGKLYTAFGEGFSLNAGGVSDDYTKTEPSSDSASFSADDRHAAHRTAVTYINPIRVAFDFSLVDGAVPFSDERVSKLWTAALAAEKEGIFYGHRRVKPHKGCATGGEDYPLIYDRTRKVMQKVGNPKVSMTARAFGQLEEYVTSIPAMRIREDVREVLIDAEDPKRALRNMENGYARLLYSKMNSNHWLLANMLGTGKWGEGHFGPEFRRKPLYSAHNPGPVKVKHMLYAITDNARRVFRGYDFAFEFQSPYSTLQRSLDTGTIHANQLPNLDKLAEEVVDLANKTFVEFNAYRN